MNSLVSQKKTVVITGSARRLGREIALALAAAGYDLVIHSSRESEESRRTISELENLGSSVRYIAANFSNPEKAVEAFSEVFLSDQSLFALVNNASIFEGGGFLQSDYQEWQRNMAINLTAPFLISQAFAKALQGRAGRILNMLDWRALRPGRDHFAYTISKSALAAMTKAMALALAPQITVNGLALGAILPPSDGSQSAQILQSVPANRWATIQEVTDTVKFLLSGPAYITGEIIHVDGGRHLV